MKAMTKEEFKGANNPMAPKVKSLKFVKNNEDKLITRKISKNKINIAGYVFDTSPPDQDLNIDGASENISMIKKKMTKGQYSNAKEMYLMCMQNTLYNCTKKLDLF